ncbi:MAG: hypothetical protein ACYTEG_02355 [Planctomycetota bacterium]|jgi:hypothetical protein
MRWLVLPLLLLVVAHAVWTLGLNWSFEAKVDALRRAGEPVRVLDLKPPDLPDEENAAVLLVEADRWYEAHLEQGEEEYYYGEWRLALDKASGERSPDEELQLQLKLGGMSAWFVESEPYIEMILEAAGRPKLQWAFDWEAGSAMDLGTPGPLVRATAFVRERVRFREGATEEGARELAALLDLAAMTKGRFFFLFLRRSSVESNCVEALQKLAGKPGLHVPSVRALLDPRLRRVEVDRSLVEAFRGERAYAIENARARVAGLRPYSFPRPMGVVERAFHSETLSGSWLIRPFVYRDSIHALLVQREAIAAAGLPLDEALAELVRIEERRDLGFPNSVASSAAFLSRRIVEVHRAHIAAFRVARVALALLERRQELGAWPASLDGLDLEPETLIDPVTGKRLEYEFGVRVRSEAVSLGEPVEWKLVEPS